MLADTETGAVTVERTKDGWLNVKINRRKYVKQFNLRDNEAAELIAELLKYGAGN